MYKRNGLSVVVLCFCFISAGANYDPFADNTLFSMNWPGAVELDGRQRPLSVDASDTENVLFMTTRDKERYQCVIPSVTGGNRKDDIKSYIGPSEAELLEPLFKQTSCSYRIESYWTYELCHGRFLRQYHEEKEPGKKVNLQEYFLGYYSIKENEGNQGSSEDKLTVLERNALKSKQAPVQKVEGVEIPYFAVNFTDGTMCDLTGGARRVSMHYVCQPDGKGEIYTLKEVSTCEYEVVVLTNVLCVHPLYELKKEPVNKIKCHSVEASPTRPRSLDNLELENTQGRYNRRPTIQGSLPTLWDHEDDDDQDDDDDDDDEEPESVLPKKDRTYHEKRPAPRPETPISSNTDKQLLSQFLAGDYCIQGGSGWWRHEFCYGKHIIQFHDEKDSRTTVLLGMWINSVHVSWLSDNPHKKPKPVGQRKSLIHYYGSGDNCDQTGKPRWVEVKLRCLENLSQPHAVAIYLMEPNTCEYTLVVESPILCPLLDQADESGIVVQ